MSAVKRPRFIQLDATTNSLDGFDVEFTNNHAFDTLTNQYTAIVPAEVALKMSGDQDSRLSLSFQEPLKRRRRVKKVKRPEPEPAVEPVAEIPRERPRRRVRKIRARTPKSDEKTPTPLDLLPKTPDKGQARPEHRHQARNPYKKNIQDSRKPSMSPIGAIPAGNGSTQPSDMPIGVSTPGPMSNERPVSDASMSVAADVSFDRNASIANEISIEVSGIETSRDLNAGSLESKRVQPPADPPSTTDTWSRGKEMPSPFLTGQRCEPQLTGINHELSMSIQDAYKKQQEMIQASVGGSRSISAEKQRRGTADHDGTLQDTDLASDHSGRTADRVNRLFNNVPEQDTGHHGSREANFSLGTNAVAVAQLETSAPNSSREPGRNAMLYLASPADDLQRANAASGPSDNAVYMVKPSQPTNDVRRRLSDGTDRDEASSSQFQNQLFERSLLARDADRRMPLEPSGDAQRDPLSCPLTIDPEPGATGFTTVQHMPRHHLEPMPGSIAPPGFTAVSPPREQNAVRRLDAQYVTGQTGPQCRDAVVEDPSTRPTPPRAAAGYPSNASDDFRGAGLRSLYESVRELQRQEAEIVARIRLLQPQATVPLANPPYSHSGAGPVPPSYPHNYSTALLYPPPSGPYENHPAYPCRVPEISAYGSQQFSQEALAQRSPVTGSQRLAPEICTLISTIAASQTGERGQSIAHTLRFLLADYDLLTHGK